MLSIRSSLSACFPKTVIQAVKQRSDNDFSLPCCPSWNSENLISEPCKHERAHFLCPLAEVLVCSPLQHERLSDPLPINDCATTVCSHRSESVSELGLIQFAAASPMSRHTPPAVVIVEVPPALAVAMIFPNVDPPTLAPAPLPLKVFVTLCARAVARLRSGECECLGVQGAIKCACNDKAERTTLPNDLIQQLEPCNKCQHDAHRIAGNVQTEAVFQHSTRLRRIGKNKRPWPTWVKLVWPNQVWPKPSLALPSLAKTKFGQNQVWPKPSLAKTKFGLTKFGQTIFEFGPNWCFNVLVQILDPSTSQRPPLPKTPPLHNLPPRNLPPPLPDLPPPSPPHNLTSPELPHPSSPLYLHSTQPLAKKPKLPK